MKKKEQRLKIEKGSKITGIVEIFEKESLIIQTISALKRYSKKVIIVESICIIILIFMQKIFNIYGTINSFVFSVFTLLIMIVVCRRIEEITYIYSKNIGGKKAKYILKKEEGILEAISYNLMLMKTEEWKLVNKILKVNNLNNINYVKELKNYFSQIKSQEDEEIKKFIGKFVSAYLIPIIGLIISIYTSIFQDISLEQNITNILAIISGAIWISLIVIVIHIFYSINKMSITNNYIYRRLEKILVEILLKKKNKFYA